MGPCPPPPSVSGEPPQLFAQADADAPGERGMRLGLGPPQSLCPAVSPVGSNGAPPFLFCFLAYQWEVTFLSPNSTL